MSGMTEGVPGQGGPVSDAVDVREAERRDAAEFSASLDRMAKVVDEMEDLQIDYADKSYSEEWALLLDETPEVASRLVAMAVAAGQAGEATAMDPAAFLMLGAQMVVAARRAGPSDNLVESIADTLAGRHDDLSITPAYYESWVREVLRLAEVI